MDNVAQVAEKLTEAQRTWVFSPDRDVFEVTDRAAVAEPEWDELAAIGVADYWTDRLTPFGMAVRSHLQATQEVFPTSGNNPTEGEE